MNLRALNRTAFGLSALIVSITLAVLAIPYVQWTMDDVVAFFARVQIILAYMGLTLPLALYLVFGAVMTFTVIVLFWQAQHSPTNKFDVVQMLLDRGRTSAGSVFKFLAGAMGIYAFGWLLVSGQMTIGYFMAFASIYYLGKSADKAIDVWKDKKDAEPPPPADTGVDDGRKQGQLTPPR